jgi:hypothetical protein
MSNIEKMDFRSHTKATEEYIDVIFRYKNIKYSTSIPIVYRRTGTDISKNEIDDYLTKVYDEIHPNKWDEWKEQQKLFWDGKPGAGVTRAFFDKLAENFEWCCVTCTLPQNPNWARRIQDIKEFGYTLATNTKKPCGKCQKNRTQIILVPLKRGGITGYETWSPELRAHIVNVLESFDSFEAKKLRKEGLLPDHKFPEIRWDSTTRRESLEDLDDKEIKRDFQLLSNQRNQQKREVCRNCFQTGSRGMIYGIPFFYHGGEKWDDSIATTGKDAEKGCHGCGWYDISMWRSELIKRLKGSTLGTKE